MRRQATKASKFQPLTGTWSVGIAPSREGESAVQIDLAEGVEEVFIEHMRAWATRTDGPGEFLGAYLRCEMPSRAAFLGLFFYAAELGVDILSDDAAERFPMSRVAAVLAQGPNAAGGPALFRPSPK